MWTDFFLNWLRSDIELKRSEHNTARLSEQKREREREHDPIPIAGCLILIIALSSSVTAKRRRSVCWELCFMYIHTELLACLRQTKSEARIHKF